MKTSTTVRASVRPRFFRWLSVGVMVIMLVGLAFSAKAPLGAQAADQATCTSTASGAWTAAIWSCAGGPGSGDDVIIVHDVDLSTNQAIHSLSVNANGSLTFRAPVTLTLSGNMSVDIDGIFDPGNAVDATGGTVVFGAGSQTINSHGKFIDFYNLTKTASAADTLSISPATAAEDGIHILNTLTLKGTAPSTLLILRSATPASQWQIRADKSLDIDYLDVQDSDNVSPVVNQPINVPHGTDSGNNTGWTFINNLSGVTLSTNVNPQLVNQPVVFTATVSPVSATGTVTFYDNINDPISGCINRVVAAGKATCTTSFATVGPESITAFFNADDPLADSVSSPLVETIVKAKIYVPAVKK